MGVGPTLVLLYARLFESCLSTATNDRILLDRLPGSGRQRISRALPHLRSPRDRLLFPKRHLGTGSGLHERRARKPCSSEDEGNQLGAHALPAIKSGHGPGISSTTLTPEGYAVTLVKAFKLKLIIRKIDQINDAIM